MKIAKALKLKNRLAGEIARIKVIVATKNVRESSHEQVYDVKQLATVELPALTEKLVLLKTYVSLANAGVKEDELKAKDLRNVPFWYIFRMAEFKGLIENIKGLDTRNGVCGERYVGNEAKPVTFVASMKQAEVDSTVQYYQKEIDDMQDSLDALNASTNYPVLDTIKM